MANEHSIKSNRRIREIQAGGYGHGGGSQSDTSHIWNGTHEKYIERRLEEGDFRGQDRKTARLILDIASILAGPTQKAEDLACSLVSAEGPEITVQALERIVKRYRMGGR